MEIRSREGSGMCAVHPRQAATRPNTAVGDAVWATFEVAMYGLEVTQSHVLYSRSELIRFIHDLSQFAANQTGEVLLRSTRLDSAHLHDVAPLWYAAQMEAPPMREATVRIFQLDQARHVALTASFAFHHQLQSTPVEDSMVVTFELDPSSLTRYAAELENDLAQA